MNKIYLLFCWLCIAEMISAQPFFFAKSNYTDSAAFDVSDETIKDTAIPMEIKWYNSSWLKLPVLR